MRSRCLHCIALLLCWLVPLACEPAWADAPRVLPAGQQPNDQRLGPLKDLDGYFPFQPSATPEQWQERAEQVRRRILVSQGLWPMPTKAALNAVIHGRIDQGDYTIEKVYFESFPGFYVTGNLYRPKQAGGKRPGVLCPHGHWPEGRFHDMGLAGVRREISIGAERFEEGGRSPLQARCVQLARMGCVVFHYDMIGYADSQQIPASIAHGFAKQRPEMNTRENWGLFSPPAEAHLHSVMGMQTFSSIRALDFLLGLEEVDPERIAVTGASGGGTQTFLLCAIDPRPTLSFPVVMVSTAMQGGCTCENASLLRVETGNIEFAALFAPKPQGLTAANDWTKEMPTKGFPELKQHYAMLGAPDNVMLLSATHFDHNYNHVSRTAMYNWVNQHFKLGLDMPVLERDYPRLSAQELTVWDAQHPQPEGGPELERKILKWWHEDTAKQLEQLVPSDASTLDRYREVVGGAVDTLIGRRLPPAEQLAYEQTHKQDKGEYLVMAGLLRNASLGEELPMLFLYPKQWSGQAVIWLSDEGKAGLLDDQGQPRPAVQQLLDRGASVIGVDLVYQGEFLADGQPLPATRRVSNPREFAGYTFGYNHTVFAQRVHDVLSVVSFVRSHERTPQRVDLVALGKTTGPIAAAARAQAGEAIGRAAINTHGFRFAELLDFHDPMFLPGGAKYFDLPGMLALAAPEPTWLAGEAEVSGVLRAAYQAAGAEEQLTVDSGPDAEREAAAVKWLLP